MLISSYRVERLQFHVQMSSNFVAICGSKDNCVSNRIAKLERFDSNKYTPLSIELRTTR